LVTYPESAPSVHATGAGQGKRGVIRGCDLGEDGVGRDSSHVGRCWGGFFWVELAPIIAVAVPAVGVDKFGLPVGVASQRAMVVDPPGQYLVVQGESGAMHGAERDLDNPDGP
jgi:hypothetical protein